MNADGVPIPERIVLAQALRRYCGVTLSAATATDLLAAVEWSKVDLALTEVHRDHLAERAAKYDAHVDAGIGAAEVWANHGGAA